ncbi:MAG: ATP-binding cassette domain-containing protein [Zetaproteobacteria bacterium]|nr:MAG: ATP-binding cassette domain-containing protein [Zetaproteobacteria bacterium]
MSKQVKIATRGLCKSFAGRPVLDHIDLDIMTGESHVIIGLSGAGKSVLLKCILGLIRPDAGSVFVNGENWCALSAEARLSRMRCIGVVFQGAALFDSLPVWRNVAFVLLQQGMAERQARARAEEVLDWVGLPNIADKMPAELSGGMKKRVGLARAFCHRPEIILYDEPLSGLDPVMSDVIITLMTRLHEEHRVTSLTIAHNMNLVRKFADRVSMLYNGKIHQQLPRDQVDQCQDPVFRQFVEGRAHGPMQVLTEKRKGGSR